MASEGNSITIGCDAFKFILCGGDIDKFMAESWEKKPLYIQSNDGSRYERLSVSRLTIDEMLRTNTIEYNKNVDVSKYEGGVQASYTPGK